MHKQSLHNPSITRHKAFALLRFWVLQAGLVSGVELSAVTMVTSQMAALHGRKQGSGYRGAHNHKLGRQCSTFSTGFAIRVVSLWVLLLKTKAFL